VKRERVTLLEVTELRSLNGVTALKSPTRTLAAQGPETALNRPKLTHDALFEQVLSYRWHEYFSFRPSVSYIRATLKSPVCTELRTSLIS
jgi:hypothetical protein